MRAFVCPPDDKVVRDIPQKYKKCKGKQEGNERIIYKVENVYNEGLYIHPVRDRLRLLATLADYSSSNSTYRIQLDARVATAVSNGIHAIIIPQKPYKIGILYTY